MSTKKNIVSLKKDTGLQTVLQCYEEKLHGINSGQVW